MVHNLILKTGNNFSIQGNDGFRAWISQAGLFQLLTRPAAPVKIHKQKTLTWHTVRSKILSPITPEGLSTPHSIREHSNIPRNIREQISNFCSIREQIPFPLRKLKQLLTKPNTQEPINIPHNSIRELLSTSYLIWVNTNLEGPLIIRELQNFLDLRFIRHIWELLNILQLANSL